MRTGDTPKKLKMCLQDKPEGRGGGSFFNTSAFSAYPREQSAVCILTESGALTPAMLHVLSLMITVTVGMNPHPTPPRFQVGERTGLCCCCCADFQKLQDAMLLLSA